jgi:hypothetical protein
VRSLRHKYSAALQRAESRCTHPLTAVISAMSMRMITSENEQLSSIRKARPTRPYSRFSQITSDGSGACRTCTVRTMLQSGRFVYSRGTVLKWGGQRAQHRAQKGNKKAQTAGRARATVSGPHRSTHCAHCRTTHCAYLVPIATPQWATASHRQIGLVPEACGRLGAHGKDLAAVRVLVPERDAAANA